VFITNFFLTADFDFETLQDKQFAIHNRDWNELRERLNLQPLDSVKRLYERGRILYADPAGLVPLKKSRLKDSFVIGPCPWQPNIPLPTELHDKRSLLFVSLGSTGPDKLSNRLISSIAELCETSTTILLHSKVDSFQEIEADRCYKQLPNDKVLRRSKITLTHGGTGTVYQALTHGIPVLVLPAHDNQKILGQIIERQKLGLLFDSVDDVAKAQMLSTQFSHLAVNCREFSQNLIKHKPGFDGAKLIEDIAVW
jgi:UDP:flavonoid glycosyltransferase YjiC (YdhE family)